jgi:hypothetical protein
MSVAAEMPPLECYCPTEDHSLGSEGLSLREALEEALSSEKERNVEAYRLVSDALRRANDADGTQVDPDTFIRTIQFLESLPNAIPLPDVVVEDTSEIGLDWDEGATRVLSLTVRDTPVMGYSALFGPEPAYGRVAFTAEVPEILRLFFRRLYPGDWRPARTYR